MANERARTARCPEFPFGGSVTIKAQTPTQMVGGRKNFAADPNTRVGAHARARACTRTISWSAYVRGPQYGKSPQFLALERLRQPKINLSASDTLGHRRAHPRYPPSGTREEMMRVFIGWSEEPSRSIAKVLHDWLQGVVQRAEPWMSDNNIDGGSRWNDRIAKALEETDFCIVCVTRENQLSRPETACS
jgi:hypothetical protein